MSASFASPLFKKLIDENTEIPFEKTPKQFLSLSDFQNEIIEDLSRLLNTRIAVFWKNYSNKNVYSPFSYGIDISSNISTENTFDIQELEKKIEEVITRFEPRLIDAKAHIPRIMSDPSVLFININATVIVENRRVSLSFPIVLNT